jgi:hypothetical protein
LPASAIIAKDVRIKIRGRKITRTTCGDLNIKRSILRQQAPAIQAPVPHIFLPHRKAG